MKVFRTFNRSLNTQSQTQSQLHSIAKLEHEEWKSFIGCVIQNDNVLLKECPDIYGVESVNNTPIFFSRTVVMYECNKNFVFYWLNRHRKVFPKMRTLYLLSHPCESKILHNLHDSRVQTFLSERFFDYKKRWCNDAPNIHEIKDKDADLVFQECNIENIKFRD